MAKPKHCLNKTVKSLQSEVYIGFKKTFKYHYQKITANQDKSKPTFIIIPGGPGNTSIRKYNKNSYNSGINADLSAEEMFWNLPPRSNIIFTDPRSLGCNKNNKLSKHTYKIKNQVNDILNIIKKEKLTNYIILGISYGSAVATQLTYLIEKQKIQTPKAVFLTATIGKALSFQSYKKALSDTWIALHAELPESVKKQLPKDFTQLKQDTDWVFPLGIDTQTWIHFLQLGISNSFRNYFVYPTQLVLKEQLMTLRYLHSSNRYRKKQLHHLKQTILSYKNINKGTNTVTKNEFYKQIWFNEIFNDTDTKEKKTFFDSKKYPIKSPIIYLHGTWDIPTPLKQALYHYKNQKHTKNKYFIKVKKGGHFVLPVLNSCKKEFWSLVNASNFKKLNKILEFCHSDLQLVL